MRSFEIDIDRRELRREARLPEGLAEGAVFATEDAFVWEGRDPNNRAVYKGGVWQRIRTSEPAQTKVVDRCTSKHYLWVLHGVVEPKSLTGPDNAVPVEDRGYEAFRYLLDGSPDNNWEPVRVSGLESSRFTEMACGEDEAFFRVGNSLFSTSKPDIRIEEAEGIVHLRGSVSKRPVAFLKGFESCAAVAPGGELVLASEPPSAVTSPVKSICDSAPWPTPSGLVAVTHDDRGGVVESKWE